MTDLFISALLVAAALALGRWPVAGRRESAAGMLLMAWHVAWCLVYWQYAQVAVADATLYLVFGATAPLSLTPGSTFVNTLSALLVRYAGLSDLNCYLAFNLVGALGLILLRTALAELSRGVVSRPARIARHLVWLPGLSFWSVAPGKDGLAFLGACAVIYALVDHRARWHWLVIGLVAAFVVRPHMATLQMIMILVAYLGGRRQGSKFFLALTAMALVAGMAIPFTLQYVGLGSAEGLDDLATYVGQRQTIVGGNTSLDITSMNPVERLFTFMFRPLFFDAPGVTGLVASVENLVWLVAIGLAVVAGLQARTPLKGILVRYSLAHLAAGWVLLGSVIANLGLAVRQKTMLLPSLLTLLVISLARPGVARPLASGGPRADAMRPPAPDPARLAASPGSAAARSVGGAGAAPRLR